MKLKQLKIFRITISLLFLLATSLLFLDFTGFFNEEAHDTILFLQFVPSIINFVSAAGILSFGFLVIIFLTALFGRVYCSTVCPLGTFQDLISRLKKKKKRKYRYSKPKNILRYAFLLLIPVSLLIGSLLAVNLLDPYSNFGRVFANLFKPIILVANNLLASFFELFDNYVLYKVDFKGYALTSLILPVVLLGTIFWLAYRHGRLYCNSICPVGTLLGLMSKFSIFKIGFNNESCTGCGKCERVCKSECLDFKSKIIDHDRCVQCYNCLADCPTEGLEFQFAGSNKTADVSVDKSKRNFFRISSGALLALSGINLAQVKIVPKKLSTVPENRTLPVSPPASDSIEDFNDLCTACHLCVSACPTDVLQPSIFEYGLTGFLQPRMDYWTGFCNFECTICTEVCPTGAIHPVKLDDKKLIQLGKAKFIKDNCIVNTEKTACGACSEHCPTKAVHMIPFDQEPKLVIPEIREEFCTGCGACEYACPTKPYKAIFVDGNSIHQLAKKNVSEKLEAEDPDEDFPF